MTKIPIDLRNAICNNELIVFAGAGMSYNLVNINSQPIKGWSNLVEQILIYLKNNGHDVDVLIPLLKKYDPIRVLDLIESDKDIPKKDIYSFIKEFLDLKNNNNVELHKKLYKLSKKIITSNYDTAFEIAVPELRKCKAYKGKNYELTTHKDPNSALLFKLHGCFEDADSMILFPTNYKNLYNNTEKDAEHSLSVFKSIVLNKSILFIGTGMGDFQINNIFNEVQKLQGEYNQKHFIILNKPLDSSLNFLSSITVNDYSKIESIIDSLILIKEECKNTDSTEVLFLKEQLLEANNKLEELNSLNPSLINRDELLEREAIKYFSKGVGYQITNNIEKAIKKYKTALELKPKYHQAFNNWGNGLGDLARTKHGKESEALFKQAFAQYKKTIEIKPDYHHAFYNWGTYLGYFARTKQGKESEELFKQTFAQYKKAVEIKPDDHQAFSNWGTDLGYFARTNQGKESEALFKQAFAQYKKAIEIKPDDYLTFNNWGTDLGDLARTKQGKESEELFKQAFSLFEKVIEIKLDYHQAFSNWGTYLGYFARTKQGKESEELFKQAFALYEKAIEINPDDHQAFSNWGTLLGELAKTKQGKESDVLFKQAFALYKNAIEIKPDYHQAFSNWGNNLGDLAEAKQGKESEALLEQAIAISKKAVAYGASSYNLSCLFALIKNKVKALIHLNISLLNNEIDIDFVEKDKDWTCYLKDKEFNELLKKYKK